MPVGSSLRGILLFSKDVVRSATLYEQGLGLQVLSCTPKFAEISAGNNGTGQAKLFIYHQENPSASHYDDPSVPFLSFSVGDVQSTLNKLLKLGSRLDGPVQFTESGQVAALRTEDGHRLGLVESAGLLMDRIPTPSVPELQPK